MILSVICIIVGLVGEVIMTILFFKKDVVSLNPTFFLLLLGHIGSVLIFALGVYLASKAKRIGNPKNWFAAAAAFSFTFSFLGF